MASIVNQNAYGSALPNFRNLGILLRILLIVNVAALAAALVKSATLRGVWNELLEISAVVQPLLILSLLALMALNGALKRLPYHLGILAVIVLELALTALLYAAGRPLLAEAAQLQRYWLLVFIVTVMLLAYFDLRGRALSPALSEARLQALQARIRPHFLFNSINAVLSLIRQDPKRAEVALEDMADLFRVLMADNRELTPLAREVELCRQYLGLEQLRLGERLKVEWHIDKMPGDALIPPLVLQPLLENAVYHGIEPRSEPGVISINIYAAREQVHAVLRNPYRHQGNHHAGNKMALGNIRERLQLHFDAEATLATRVADDNYQVHIVMPYIKGRSP
jgi:two-component system sensor histidine kinase AlgZ